LIAALDLVQAELRVARQQAMRLGLALGIVLAAAGILFSAWLILLYALYQWLLTEISPIGAAAVTGLAALLVSIVLLFFAQRHGQQP